MKFSELGKSTRDILRLCDDIVFGDLTDLAVIDGEIHTTSATKRHTTIRLDNDPRKKEPRRGNGDFILNAAQERLVREARANRNARITFLDIREGRPANLSFEEVMPAN